MTSKDTRRFVKSTFSGGNAGNCVEWAVTAAGVYVRDSKDRDGAELLFTHAEWDGFVAGARAGECRVALGAA